MTKVISVSGQNDRNEPGRYVRPPGWNDRNQYGQSKQSSYGNRNYQPPARQGGYGTSLMGAPPNQSYQSARAGYHSSGRGGAVSDYRSGQSGYQATTRTSYNTSDSGYSTGYQSGGYQTGGSSYQARRGGYQAPTSYGSRSAGNSDRRDWSQQGGYSRPPQRR